MSHNQRGPDCMIKSIGVGSFIMKISTATKMIGWLMLFYLVSSRIHGITNSSVPYENSTDNEQVSQPSEPGPDPELEIMKICRDPANSNKCNKPGWLENMLCSKDMFKDICEDIQPKFLMFGANKEYELFVNSTKEDIIAAGYNPQKYTTIMIHGWQQTFTGKLRADWLNTSRILYWQNKLIKSDNLIIMDWGAAAYFCYKETAARVYGVSKYLTKFLLKLIDELGADRKKINLVGHSLGSHMAAFAGKSIRPKIGRITSLDSAGICFGKLSPKGPESRLTKDDALEVIVYHYDDVHVGLPGNHGHIDIYVNGGKVQPGCKIGLTKLLELVDSFITHRQVTVSHTRSTQVASVNLANTRCQQVAYECKDYESFNHGECGQCDQENSQCFLTGLALQYGRNTGEYLNKLQAPFDNKQLYISTSADGAYCLHHYQILVKFEPNPEIAELAKSQKWRLKLNLVNEEGEQLRVETNHQLEPNVFSHLLLYEGSREPTKVSSARLQLQWKGKSLPDSVRVASVEINFMSNIDPEVRKSLSTRLCPTHKEANFKQSGLGDSLIVLLECHFVPL